MTASERGLAVMRIPHQLATQYSTAIIVVTHDEKICLPLSATGCCARLGVAVEASRTRDRVSAASRRMYVLAAVSIAPERAAGKLTEWVLTKSLPALRTFTRLRSGVPGPAPEDAARR